MISIVVRQIFAGCLVLNIYSGTLCSRVLWSEVTLTPDQAAKVKNKEYSPDPVTPIGKDKPSLVKHTDSTAKKRKSGL